MAATLWSLVRGERCTILGYTDSLADPYRIRLMEFGFHVGESVTCLQSPALGAPKVYRVSSTVYSLDDEIASCVLVERTAV